MAKGGGLAAVVRCRDEILSFTPAAYCLAGSNVGTLWASVVLHATVNGVFKGKSFQAFIPLALEAGGGIDACQVFAFIRWLAQ